LTWRVFLHAMNTGRRKTAISTEQKKTTFPRRQSSCGRKGPAIGLDHVKRRQPKSRNCSYSSRVSPQLHQRKTRNCGLAHLRREAATKHEGRVCKVGVREGWPCVGYTPPLQLATCVWLSFHWMCTISAGYRCTSVPQGLPYKQPMLEHPGDFEGTTYSSTS
jgi:hypothetical protein